MTKKRHYRLNAEPGKIFESQRKKQRVGWGGLFKLPAAIVGLPVKGKYPQLKLAIQMLAEDSGLSMRDESKWVWPAGVEALEEEASRLSQYQLDILSSGERESAERIINEYQVHALDEFLEEVFQGDLSTAFFDPY